MREREVLSANMPKATPGFCERTRLKNPGITAFESIGAQVRLDHPFGRTGPQRILPSPERMRALRRRLR